MTRDEQGVSSIIGAVLILAIFVSAMVMVQVSFVPRWDEDREAQHTDQVGNQIGGLKVEMDRQAAGITDAPITGHVDLRAEGSRGIFSSGYRLAGEARLAIGADQVVFNAPSITVQSSGGTSLLGVQETWEAIQDGVEVGPIDKLLHLRVRVPNPHALSAGITSTLTVHDAQGAYAGKIEMRNGDDAVYVSTYNAESTTTPISNRLDDTDPDGPTFYFNLLDDNLLFDSIIAAAEAPVSLLLDDGGLPADYSVVYDRITATGIERVGAEIGVTTLNFGFAASAGALEIELNHQEFVDQVYVIEHGAVLLVQPDGAVMVAPPSMTAVSGPNQHNIRWTVPTLQGPPTSVSTPQATITMSKGGDGVAIDASLPRFNMTLPTSYPALWGDFWTRTLEAAGIDGAAGEYTIMLTADSATLSVYGPVTGMASTTNDVILDLRQADVLVNVTPFG